MLAVQECQNTLLKEKYVGNYVIFEKCNPLECRISWKCIHELTNNEFFENSL